MDFFDCVAFGSDATTSDGAIARAVFPPPPGFTCFFFFVAPLSEDSAEEEEDPSVDDAAESGIEMG